MLEMIINIIKNILASIGISFILLIYVCLGTNIPTDLFNMLKVEPKIEKADAIVVLGAGTTLGGKPSRFSLERAVEGVILYKEGYAPYIIFSGGWDHDGYISSAEAMANMAKDLGVPESNIIIENLSHDTYQNSLNTLKIMQDAQMKTALLVTSDSHMKRSALLFQKQGIAVYPVPVEEALVKPELSWRSKIHNFSILYQVLYEASAAMKYKNKGWI
ncbi:MAG: YdcF family protein [Cyanobacteriota bacterium]